MPSMWKAVLSWLGAASTANWLRQLPAKIPMPWKRRAIPTLRKCGKGSYAVEARDCTELVGYIKYHKIFDTMEARRVVLSWLTATRTIKDSNAVEVGRSSYTVEVRKVGSSQLTIPSTIKRFLRHGSVEGFIKLVGFIEYHKRFLRHGCME